MRSLITTLGLLASTALFACDNGSTTKPGVQTGAARGGEDDVCELSDAMASATCHAAYRDAMGRIDSAREDAATCKVDSDCTITVTETRCTGEIVSAVNSASESSFLGFVDRVDARLCADVQHCATPGEDDPEDLHVSCIENRCAID